MSCGAATCCWAARGRRLTSGPGSSSTSAPPAGLRLLPQTPSLLKFVVQVLDRADARRGPELSVGAPSRGRCDRVVARFVAHVLAAVPVAKKVVDPPPR